MRNDGSNRRAIELLPCLPQNVAIRVATPCPNSTMRAAHDGAKHRQKRARAGAHYRLARHDDLLDWICNVRNLQRQSRCSGELKTKHQTPSLR